MKKLLLFLLVLAGGVSTASAYDQYWIVGDTRLGTNWDKAPNGWEMSTTDGKIYTLTVSNVTLTAEETYKFKARSKQSTWDGATSYGSPSNSEDSYNQAYSVYPDKGGTYDLLFVLDKEQAEVRLIILNSLQLKGDFDKWAGTNMTSEGGYSYSYTLDLTSKNTNEQFKFYVDVPGHNFGENDFWIGTDKIGLSDFDSWSGSLSSTSGHYEINQNIIKGYKKFNITAVWHPCNKIEYGWKFTITPSEMRDDVNKVLFDNTKNWSNVYAYSWTPSGTETKLNASWPGEEITKIDGLYTYFYTTSYSKILFNDGTGSNAGTDKTSDLDFVADRVYNMDGVNSASFTLNSYGKATYCSTYPLNFSTATPAGLKAYKITASNKETGELTKEEVTKVPAGVGVYLEGTENTEYIVPTTATATSISGNMLVGVTSSTIISQTAGANTNYILTVNKAGSNVAESEPKFFKVNTAGNTVGANKAYLQIPTANAAREYFWFDDEATGINAAKVSQPTGEIFDLQGRRVAQPTKGLYIVNGKKYFAK